MLKVKKKKKEPSRLMPRFSDLFKPVDDSSIY